MGIRASNREGRFPGETAQPEIPSQTCKWSLWEKENKDSVSVAEVWNHMLI
jgi:hypothetical protein